LTMSRTPHRGATDGGGGPLWDGIALAIHLSEEIGRDALAVMVSVVMGKLGKFWPDRGPRRQPRDAVIYGRTGASSSVSPLRTTTSRRATDSRRVRHHRPPRCRAIESRYVLALAETPRRSRAAGTRDACSHLAPRKSGMPS
jgi:hypothetical protein